MKTYIAIFVSVIITLLWLKEMNAKDVPLDEYYSELSCSNLRFHRMITEHEALESTEKFNHCMKDFTVSDCHLYMAEAFFWRDIAESVTNEIRRRQSSCSV